MDEANTQTHLNLAAANDLARARANNSEAVQHLLEVLAYDSREGKEFERSERAFDGYCGAMERFAFAIADGGTIGPLLAGTLVKKLIDDRTDLLRSLRNELLRGRERV